MKSFATSLIATCAFFGLMNSAFADECWYTKGFGGISYFNRGVEENEPESLMIQLDRGYIGGLAFGVKIRNVKAEIEMTHRHNNLQMSTTPDSVSGAFFDLKGHDETDNLVGNIIVDIFPNRFINPYVGVGAGGSFKRVQLAGYARDPHKSFSYYAEGSDASNNFITQEMAGLYISVAETADIGFEGRLTHDLKNFNTCTSVISSLAIRF